MSLKSRLHLKPTSIARRLTILYTVCTLLLLSTSTIFLDQILVTDMSREDSQFLAAEVLHLRMLLERYPDNVSLWREEVERETRASELAYMKYYVRILDHNGNIEIETPGMDRIVTQSSFPAPPDANETLDKGIKAVGKDNTPLLVMAAQVNSQPPGTGKRTIQIALDVSHQDGIIADYREKMAFVLFAGMILSTFIGFSVARGGLRPLRAMGRAFKRIGAERLHERLGTRQWPDEVAVLARAFDDMLDRLENSFVSLSRFSADLAHELRTPINNLRGEAEVALYKARTSDEYRQVLESGLEEYGRLSRMIENLLFLARTENTDAIVRRSAVHVLEEVETLLEFFDPIAEEKEIKVVCNGDATLEADPGLFRHALTNILSNAFQYTPKGGKITVTARELDDRSIQVEIADTGMGIEPENLGRIFDRFFRTDSARAQHPQGTGLGFSIVKSIMDLHGGTVTVLSEAGTGTTVVLNFPRFPS